jgi:hypothetical protein
MMDPREARSLTGWILVAGFVLASIGLAAGQDDPPGGNPGQVPTQAIPFTTGYGTADSNGSMIAVTGVDVTGGSLLFLVDTVGRHISIYQATGGTRSTMNLKWVGARNIDLDLQVDGWNDQSELTYKELFAKFEEQGSVDIPKK